LRIAVLASGSSGNATVVEAGDSAILIDCGLSVRRLEQRAVELQFDLSKLSGIAVTHEHGDHIGGVGALARRYKLPVYMTHGTRVASSFDDQQGLEIREISPHESFKLGQLDVHPAPVPHDAREPCQFVIESQQARVGVLVLEFNHDPGMLDECEYPESVKDRIAGRLGHFNNHQAVQLLSKLHSKCLQHVLAAHISERANDNNLVQRMLQQSLAGTGIAWGVAHQDRVTPWISV